MKKIQGIGNSIRELVVFHCILAHYCGIRGNENAHFASEKGKRILRRTTEISYYPGKRHKRCRIENSKLKRMRIC